MAADMAVELRKQNVACISLWPGPVKTELVQDLVLDKVTESTKSEKVIFSFKWERFQCLLLELQNYNNNSNKTENRETTDL